MKNMKRFAAVAALTLAFPWQVMAAGAIAVDEDQEVIAVGAAYGTSSTSDAGKVALAKCVETGHHSCKVAVRYEHCGAYAASWRFSSVGTGSTKAEAINMALRDCKECRVVVADCESNSTLRSASLTR